MDSLPVELIQQIHLLALNPFFPQTSRTIYASLHRSSPFYIAEYLFRLYRSHGPNEVLVRALRHPVCDIHVVKALVEAWNRSLSRRADNQNDQNRSRQIPVVPPLTCRELPRRLFRSPPLPSTPIPPLIIYIFDTFAQTSDPTYDPSPNSHKGYPLCRAVLQSNYELVTYLLQKGADPSLKDYMAVEIAVSMKDLKMVKLLIEREQSGFGTTRTGDESESPTKKMKLGDRITVPAKMVESAMKKGTKDIVNYLVYDKKVIPPLSSIMDLGKPDAKSKAKTKHQFNKSKKRKAGFQ
ncbi:hypothetical protein CNBN2190 [Cryptococcus deneoformans B-3501A]|uniref:hypothetical protein n=1 Tax=Cryptococcus deneoformans (strain B-3501A) TaxID=283643 RepID=UPI000042F0B5|nr:hypothetical protein CNBN2190 [Cryptococcus neoformans var. neoformans B-3501A]EAL17127.1 hypothetical protein CNBN2190 [Cryptococcus neoformans var. neoformans B-3501A]